ncbi:MAG: FKBP-type peptidyl-prolyl cis-trans isomerase [Bacteroidota bacterium]
MLKTLFLSIAISPLFVVAQSSKSTIKVVQPVRSGKPLPFKNALDSFSYAMGINIGYNLSQSGIDKINPAMMLKAFDDILAHREPLFDVQTSNKCVNEYFAPIVEKKLKAVKERGEKFLEENKKRAGVITLSNGIQYEILKDSTGPKPVDTNSVKVHYTGTFTDGKTFDSSIGEDPITVNLRGGVISGWLYILRLMPVGSKWKVYIPAELAYGEKGSRAIPPGSALIFELELLEIVK